jgi:[ribosomal protein S18]-alanine N-acetyltransferase
MTHDVVTFSIEPATFGMLPDILSIEEASFTAPWTRKMFEVELTHNPFSWSSVARMGGSRDVEEVTPILGYVCFWVVFDELRMMNLAVATSARRQGIGRMLLMHALKMGQEKGARRALLEVRASNAPALALYEHAGFCRTGLRRQYYSRPEEDAVLMEMNSLTASH